MVPCVRSRPPSDAQRCSELPHSSGRGCVPICFSHRTLALASHTSHTHCLAYLEGPRGTVIWTVTLGARNPWAYSQLLLCPKISNLGPVAWSQRSRRVARKVLGVTRGLWRWQSHHLDNLPFSVTVSTPLTEAHFSP